MKNEVKRTRAALVGKTAFVLALAGTVFATTFEPVEAAPIQMTGAYDGSIVTEVQSRRTRRRRRGAAIGLGIAGAIIGGAIAQDRVRRTRERRYARDCWYEREERWSRRRGRYVIRTVKVCD